MSRDLSFSRLFRLIDDSLRPYTESEVISLTKDREKDLLIALSQVWREIQLMKQERDCDSDEDHDWESDGEKKPSEDSELRHEHHNCSTKVLAELMILLTVESQFVQHLAGNVLAVVSEFVAASGNEWDSFFPSLFICLKLAISNMLPYSMTTSTKGPKDRNCDPSTLGVLRSGLKNANWSTVGAIIRVLRNTLKYLKEEDDEQLLETYMDCISYFLLDVPWDVMEETQVYHGSDAQESYGRSGRLTETKLVFLGNFIQLLCSLVEQSCSLEAKIGAKDKHHPFLCVIIGFVPRIFRLCLGKEGNCANLSISLYFRHKLLMLMLRLSYLTCLGYSTLTSWLQLLHDYYDEHLCKPIIELEFSQDEFLEGSPFLVSLSDGEQGFSSCHLQRWGILLFLRCCFSLISSTGDIHEQCAGATPNSYSTFDSISNLNYARKTGFLELFKWLQGHLPTDISVAHEMYLENCIGFASSFLQLYMHEDDVLFKVLLQLLSIQSSLEKQSEGEKWAFEDVNKDIVFQLLSIFNPVYLFHLFLAELHYDHQVILDYLISKDTGASCAEYLLRSLRVACNSWNLFVTFSVHEKVKNPASYKKRKILFDGSNVQTEVSSVISEHILSSGLEKQKKESTTQMFNEAKNCLLSLKCSVENLHRKKLFPYNPEVILRRLTKFQELCSDLNNHGIFSIGETT